MIDTQYTVKLDTKEKISGYQKQIEAMQDYIREQTYKTKQERIYDQYILDTKRDAAWARLGG